MSKKGVKKTTSGGFILQKGSFGLWLGRSSGKCFSTQSGLRIGFGVPKRDFGGPDLGGLDSEVPGQDLGGPDSGILRIWLDSEGLAGF